MRRLLIPAVLLACAAPAVAQDKPLGDVARETREQRLNSPHATKLYTNDGSNPPLPPVTAADNPGDVVNKSIIALLRDPLHSCRREVSGNSGPGWAEERTTDVVAPGRIHVLVHKTRPQSEVEELIRIGSDTYLRTSVTPWQKMPAGTGLSNLLANYQLPDVLKFGYGPGDLMLIGQETTDGSPSFHYEVRIHAGEMDRTIDIWVAAEDHLPLRTHMLTVTRSWGSAPITWQESSSCAYGLALTIDPPI